MIRPRFLLHPTGNLRQGLPSDHPFGPNDKPVGRWTDEEKGVTGDERKYFFTAGIENRDFCWQHDARGDNPVPEFTGECGENDDVVSTDIS